MAQRLAGKRALVTGAASGIGRAVAETFAREGATVAVHARTLARGRETVDAITTAGGRAIGVAADLADSKAIEAMCADAIARLGGIEILVNNAGMADSGKVTDLSESLWDSIMAVNLKAPFLVSKFILPAMLARGEGGVIIFTASTNGKTADAEWTAYNTSKHGLIGFMRCLAAEVGKSQIRVNALCPGWLETKMAHEVLGKIAAEAGHEPGAFYDEVMRTNMMGALLPASTAADLALFLASDEGRYITGQAINVCAGLCTW
jgi:NAD(P)-dependent dehydrogenase (short-subunit alcohol dehydrogenase family)